MPTHVLKTTMRGTAIGLLLGVVSGGLWSALFGQPFSGATGWKVFHLGMFFPGLVIAAPVTAGIGAVCGAIASWMRRKKGSRDTLEFTVDEKLFRVQSRGAFGLLWGPSHGMRSHVPILYLLNDPNRARLADFTARFSMPLILLVLGLMFAPAGWLLCRDSKRLSNEGLGRFMDPFRNC